MSNGRLTVDFWYSDKMADCDNIDCYFSDTDCIYRGNFYRNNKAVGDYTATTLQAISTAWDKAHAPGNRV